MRLIRALRDCTQRSLTVSKKAPTVSKKAPPHPTSSNLNSSKARYQRPKPPRPRLETSGRLKGEACCRSMSDCQCCELQLERLLPRVSLHTTSLKSPPDYHLPRERSSSFSLQLEASCLQLRFFACRLFECVFACSGSSFVEASLLITEVRVRVCLSTLRDCKQKNATASTKAPTESKKASPFLNVLPANSWYEHRRCL